MIVAWQTITAIVAQATSAVAWPLARLDDERLEGAPHGAVHVVRHALGQAGAPRGKQRTRVDPGPLPLRRSLKVQRQVRVDEEVSIEAQLRAHAVAEVADGGQQRERAGLAPRKQRQAHPHPNPSRPEREWLCEP